MSEQMKNEHSKQISDRLLAERLRQVNQEGWTIEHDNEHDCEELAQAAACYALGKTTVEHQSNDGFANLIAEINLNPFGADFKNAVEKKSRIRQLEIAGAFIIAEIERLERAKNKTESTI